MRSAKSEGRKKKEEVSMKKEELSKSLYKNLRTKKEEGEAAHTAHAPSANRSVDRNLFQYIPNPI